MEDELTLELALKSADAHITRINIIHDLDEIDAIIAAGNAEAEGAD